MALLSTRINLMPTVRSLASGVPSSKVALALPAAAHHHAAGGPRSDAPAAWVSSTNGSSSVSRINARPTGFTRQRFFSTSAVAQKSSTGVPDFSPYTTNNEGNNRALSYFMVGSLGVLAASGAKATVSDVLSNMSASADVLALAKVEVEMASIPEGRSVIIKWRGKPVFIRHRTAGEIDEANQVDVKTLRDPQTDDERVQRPEWLVMVGVCTHLGCVPIGEAGDFGGWFCPCHGSHYDISGRIRRGPAPLNLEVPEYSFNDGEEKIVVG